ncbi:MAG: carboxylating nicotinate-nucleotide diphosphorylase [Candidatus Gracilibacteria bacterium]|nr:carboxylating nicotinate-nucleotide diphosphorylase [Candidatus Gracilibacteria bacterium]
MNKTEIYIAKQIITEALKEDLGRADVTSLAIRPFYKGSKGFITAKANGVIAGLEIVKAVFCEIEPAAKVKFLVKDGARVKKGQQIVEIKASFLTIMAGERIALNFLQRLSGIATLTAEYVAAAAPVKVLDTRKTTPGWRILEKYAVRAGGGQNHRLGLYDQILIKDNHIAAAGGVKKSLERVKKYKDSSKGLKPLVEIECKPLKQVREALPFLPQIIMLDNMSDQQIKQASLLIRQASRKLKIEVSGGITLDRLKTLRKLDIDFVSVGALTHSARALDLSLTLFSSRRSRTANLSAGRQGAAHANDTTSQVGE